ncbi:hypothetical protein KY289_017300 [Solanum tuberosum]|nr:hypothetical protein KY289_017300 [Solanum tuberosum]
MELNEDIVVDIISRLPVKLAVQCKVLSKSFNNKLCEPNISQSFASRWFRDQNITNLLIYWTPSPTQSSYEISNYSCKFFCSNPRLRLGYERRSSSLNVSLLTSCKGLLLLEFHKFKTFCIFNPITKVHQLISYPEPTNYFSTVGGGAGLAIDHPTTNHNYKLVTVGMLNKCRGYRFRVFSSEEAGVVWHEFLFLKEVYYRTSIVSPQPVFVHDCLHWLTSDGNVLAFDTKSSTGQATIINLPREVLHVYLNDPMYGAINFMFDAVLELVRGVLTLVCSFKKFIVIFCYDYVSRKWKVSYTLPNFKPDLVGRVGGPASPICFDGEKLFIFGRYRAAQRTGYLYEYVLEMKTYKKVGEVFNMHSAIFFWWEPTLARIPKTELPPYKVHSKHFPEITATLDELRCLIANKPRVDHVTKTAINN